MEPAFDWSRQSTARMRLEPPAPADLPDLCAMESDARTMVTLLGVRSADQTAAGLGRMMDHWQRHGFGWWILRDPVTGEFLGRGGLRRVPVEGVEEIEVGYGFHARHWGRGLATELARFAIARGFEHLGVDSIVSFTLPDNLASRRVMEKCGLVHERDGAWAGVPHVFYRLMRPAGAGV